MPRIICTLPNASDEISGVKFAAQEDGSKLSDEVSQEAADAFLEIEGYLPVAPPAPAPKAPSKAVVKPAQAPAPTPAPAPAPAAAPAPATDVGTDETTF